MRIVLLGPAYPYRGGLAAFNERLAEALLDAGHEVEIVTFTLQYPDFLFPGKQQTSERPAPTRFKITRKLNSVNPLSYYRTGRYIRSLKPDVILTRFWLPFMGPALGASLRVARTSTTRTLAIIDNIIPHESRPGDRPLARYFTNSVDGFLVMSEAVGRDLQQFLKPKQQVVYHPHPVYDHYGERVSRLEALSYLGLPTGPRYALFFGFIRDYKGLDLLLDAMADERIRQLNIKLIVAGEFYGNESAYRQQIARLDLADRLVLRTDYIPDDQVRYYFGAADVVVQPYKTATQSGISQMAYHFRKPMIVTRVGGLPEIIPDGEAGYVVDVSAKAIADALVRFFTEADHNRFAQNMEQLAKQYGWEAFVEQLEGLI